MSSAARTPPRYVPTLTEVVYPSVAPTPDLAVDAKTTAEKIADSESFGSMQEQMIHRVMQRVDVLIEQRLLDAITTVVQQHTKSLEPLLREEIEYVVRQSVSEAVAEELPLGRPAGVQ
ncbi:MAG: hypothetical protein EPN61_16580 [Burkholderiaceae bacterium]|nr:MAG: hypothetical protein EPN61_16580 [Burkholderiaceae bacterium]